MILMLYQDGLKLLTFTDVLVVGMVGSTVIKTTLQTQWGWIW